MGSGGQEERCSESRDQIPRRHRTKGSVEEQETKQNSVAGEKARTRPVGTRIGVRWLTERWGSH